MNDFTIVTGLWDIGRGSIEEFTRSFEHYLDTFNKLLGVDFNMCIHIPSELVEFVSKVRKPHNTKIYLKELSDFDSYLPNFSKIQSIRNTPSWFNQAEWLVNSPQAKLKYYNPIVMSKFLMLDESMADDPFNTKYFFWLDAGIVNTVTVNQIQNLSSIIDFMENIDDKFLFLSFPYETETEVHGFTAKKFNQFCGVNKTTYVCRGGFFGGHKKDIHKFRERYEFFLKDSIDLNLMGTEECIHTMLSYRYDDEVYKFELSDSGLVYTFFEHLGTMKKLTIKNINLIPYDKKKAVEDIKTSLYVLTYNSPNQFTKLMESYDEVDSNFVTATRKILVDNSTKPENYAQYQALCKKYGFEHIRKEDNLGICGGRQFIADHFHESDSEYYCFLEDDMNLNTQKDKTCASGFRTYTEDLYKKSLTIIHKEQYDFLKFSYSEFFGTNQNQWAWYNVPQKVRDKYFYGSTEAPKLEATNRKRFKDLYYLEGDYYYCNWPMWMSRKGNAKVFLETRWQHPHEQTWMSYCFQQQKRGKIKSAVLELSPIFHHRFDHYPAEERKES